MDDLSLDDALSLEANFYSEGFQEGQEQHAREQFLEGKIYGLQTGFQRFLIVGYLQGLLEFWRQTTTNIDSHLDQMEKALQKITSSNDDSAVAQYEKAVNSARNKARIIASLTKTTEKLHGLDALIKEVGGNMQVAENMNEMW